MGGWNLGPQRGPQNPPSPARLRAQKRSIEVNDPPLIKESQIRDLRTEDRVPATPKPDFAIPHVECCGAPMICEAFNDSGEIEVYMVCDSCDKRGPVVQWPFVETWAYEQDFSAIGIHYEY